MDEADARAVSRRRRRRNSAARSADVLLDNPGVPGRARREAPATSGTTGCAAAHNIRRADMPPITTSSWCRTTSLTWPEPSAPYHQRASKSPAAQKASYASTTSDPPRSPGMDAKDVIDVQLTVASLDVADELNDALAMMSAIPACDHITAERAASPTIRPSGASGFTARPDPGRPAFVYTFASTDGRTNSSRLAFSATGLAANPAVQAGLPSSQAAALAAHRH